MDGSDKKQIREYKKTIGMCAGSIRTVLDSF